MFLLAALPCNATLHTGVKRGFGLTLIEPDEQVYDWIEKFDNLLAGWNTLFLTDDSIADETLDK